MRSILLTLLSALLLSSVATADNHSSPQPLPADRFNALIAATGPIELGEEVYRGVRARAELESLPDTAGRYLLTVTFRNEKNKVLFLEGDVAVKVTTPNGKVSAPARLNPEEGRFQVEVLLPSTGESQLKIGSKLPDEKKRIYRFFYNVM